MVEKMRLLQAEIKNSLNSIEEIYRHLEAIDIQANDSSQDIVLAYYLHVLYGTFENIFVRIAETFENTLTNQTRWHSQLLRQMSLDVMPVRPPVISRETYTHLNELRSFRHLFRNAYLLQFDPDRLNMVLSAAHKLRSTYPADFRRFMDFLEQLVQTNN